MIARPDERMRAAGPRPAPAECRARSRAPSPRRRARASPAACRGSAGSPGRCRRTSCPRSPRGRALRGTSRTARGSACRGRARRWRARARPRRPAGSPAARSGCRSRTRRGTPGTTSPRARRGSGRSGGWRTRAWEIDCRTGQPGRAMKKPAPRAGALVGSSARSLPATGFRPVASVYWSVRGVYLQPFARRPGAHLVVDRDERRVVHRGLGGLLDHAPRASCSSMVTSASLDHACRTRGWSSGRGWSRPCPWPDRGSPAASAGSSPARPIPCPSRAACSRTRPWSRAVKYTLDGHRLDLGVDAGARVELRDRLGDLVVVDVAVVGAVDGDREAVRDSPPRRAASSRPRGRTSAGFSFLLVP